MAANITKQVYRKLLGLFTGRGYNFAVGQWAANPCWASVPAIVASPAQRLGTWLHLAFHSIRQPVSRLSFIGIASVWWGYSNNVCLIKAIHKQNIFKNITTKNTSKSMEKIAFIVGAGAVENAWQPILKLFEESFGYKIDADGANCFFARKVYLMRFYATATFPDAKKYLDLILADVHEMKIEIAKALSLAEKNEDIKARQELKDILYKFVFSTTNQSVLITTNWDTVIDNAINVHGQSNDPQCGGDIQSLHFHGSVNTPELLYLPSEVVKEPYREDVNDMKLGTLHGRVWRTIEQSTRTILYGLSIDPLDAELSQTLAAGWSSPNIKEIIIINPDHKKVAQRVKLLLDERYPANIIGYSPGDLNTKYNYE